MVDNALWIEECKSYLLMEMNTIFHDMIGCWKEVHIDDVIVKSKKVIDHLGYLKRVLERMRPFELKMNSLKCAFEVKVGNFLGFLVHQKGVEVDHNKAKAINEAKSLANKKEL